MVQIFSKELLSKPNRQKATFKPGVDLKNFITMSPADGGKTMAEITAGEFSEAWLTRQRYEVDTGRGEEPVLYTPLYNIINDPNLPRNVSINTLGPGGVVFEEVAEGGEVKFASLSSGERSVRIRHYGVGLEYSKDMVLFNELWNLAIVERAAGKAYNALLNHVHLYPILNYAYAAANQTAADATGSTLSDKMLLTFENAVTNATEDNTNHRPGPYVLLASPSDRFKIERALTVVPQEGFTRQSSVIGMIPQIIYYNGWTGTRGAKTTTYPGVTAGKAYLIDVSNRDMDFQSFVKQDLTQERGNPDVSRFILEQVIWDVYFGVYANPLRAVEEITLPTS